MDLRQALAAGAEGSEKGLRKSKTKKKKPRCTGENMASMQAGSDRGKFHEDGIVTHEEAALREKIAAEIAERFGCLAPYKLVQDFVRKGTKS